MIYDWYVWHYEVQTNHCTDHFKCETFSLSWPKDIIVILSYPQHWIPQGRSLFLSETSSLFTKTSLLDSVLVPLEMISIGIKYIWYSMNVASSYHLWACYKGIWGQSVNYPCRLLTRDFITFVATHLHRVKGEMSHFGYQCNVIMMSHETKKISLTTPLTIYIKIVKQERFTSCVYNRA